MDEKVIEHWGPIVASKIYGNSDTGDWVVIGWNVADKRQLDEEVMRLKYRVDLHNVVTDESIEVEFIVDPFDNWTLRDSMFE